MVAADTAVVQESVALGWCPIAADELRAATGANQELPCLLLHFHDARRVSVVGREIGKPGRYFAPKQRRDRLRFGVRRPPMADEDAQRATVRRQFLHIEQA